MFDHTTSRQCDDPQCRGELDDSIINFGENLPEGELKKAFTHAKMVNTHTHTHTHTHTPQSLISSSAGRSVYSAGVQPEGKPR